MFANFAYFQFLNSKQANAEKRYRDLIENVKEVIFECTADGTFLFLNEAWKDILSFEKEQSIFDCIQTYVYEEDTFLIEKLLHVV